MARRFRGWGRAQVETSGIDVLGKPSAAWAARSAVFLRRGPGVITVVADGVDVLAAKQTDLFTYRGLRKQWL